MHKGQTFTNATLQSNSRADQVGGKNSSGRNLRSASVLALMKSALSGLSQGPESVMHGETLMNKNALWSQVPANRIMK
jgi:hypothetical protein